MMFYVNPPSAALLKELVVKVSFKRCEYAAFQELKQTLQKWFSQR